MSLSRNGPGKSRSLLIRKPSAYTSTSEGVERAPLRSREGYLKKYGSIEKFLDRCMPPAITAEPMAPHDTVTSPKLRVLIFSLSSVLTNVSNLAAFSSMSELREL